jgi:hypothetical protein
MATPQSDDAPVSRTFGPMSTGSTYRRRQKRLKQTYLWEPNDRPSGDSDFCNRCRRINFPAIFNPHRQVSENSGLFIMPLEELEMDAACPVCRLFNYVGSQTHDDGFEGYHLRIFLVNDPFSTVVSATYGVPVLALVVLPGRSKDATDHFFRWSRPDKGVVMANFQNNVAQSTSPALEGLCVPATLTCYDSLESWLQECDLHVGTCDQLEPSPALSVPLSCIDCLTRAIVQIGKVDDYLALSYVWGSCVPMPPAEGLRPLLRLPDQGVHQIIEDAMVVVVGIGKHYLWVDQYCIEQPNHDARNQQIREMDRIYAGAYATIIACAGSSAGYGLPGISRERRELSVSTSSIDLHPTHSRLADVIANTT